MSTSKPLCKIILQGQKKNNNHPSTAPPCLQILSLCVNPEATTHQLLMKKGEQRSPSHLSLSLSGSGSLSVSLSVCLSVCLCLCLSLSLSRSLSFFFSFFIFLVLPHSRHLQASPATRHLVKCASQGKPLSSALESWQGGITGCKLSSHFRPLPAQEVRCVKDVEFALPVFC